MKELLRTSSEGMAGPLRLTLRREESRWRADFHWEEAAEFPLEAKTWPVQRVGVRAEVLQALVAAGKRLASRVWVPTGAQVRWQVEVTLEDERVTGVETTPPLAFPGGRAVKSAPELVGTWVNVVVPFTQALDPRKLWMEWEGTHIPGSGQSRWKLITAGVRRPPPPEPRNAEVALEYYAMHEQIQRRWRQETRESFQAAGVFTAEQVALFVVGGWIVRGAGLVTEAAAPTVAKVVAQGGTKAVGWFRSLLARAAPAERQSFARLMAKAETQGLEALSVGERTEIKALLIRMEELTSRRLSAESRDELRGLARANFAKTFPRMAEELRTRSGGQFDIHHRIPLDFAHLFPSMDINAMENLAAVEPSVHRGINKIWRAYTNGAGASANATTVEKVAGIVERRFGRWYSNPPQVPASDELIDRAIAEALQELQALLLLGGRGG